MHRGGRRGGGELDAVADQCCVARDHPAQVLHGHAVGEHEPDLRRAAADELGRRALGDESPARQHADPVGQVLGLVEVVGRQQHGGAAGAQLAHELPGVAPRRRVEARRRFVEEEQRRTPDDAERQVEPAPLTAGQGADPPVGLRRQVDELDDLGRVTTAAVAGAIDVDGLGDGQLVLDPGSLQHDADAIAELPGSADQGRYRAPRPTPTSASGAPRGSRPSWTSRRRSRRAARRPRPRRHGTRRRRRPARRRSASRGRPPRSLPSEQDPIATGSRAFVTPWAIVRTANGARCSTVIGRPVSLRSCSEAGTKYPSNSSRTPEAVSGSRSPVARSTALVMWASHASRSAGPMVKGR